MQQVHRVHFQFHKGAIETYLAHVDLRGMFAFNSIKVRLKQVKDESHEDVCLLSIP